MKLSDFQIFSLRIPFKLKFSHSLATRSVSESVLLALADTQGHQGYGEGTPRPYVTGETIDGTMRVLQEILPDLSTEQMESVQDIDRLLSAYPALDTAPSARCALELALLDLLGQNMRQSVLQLLGTPQTEAIYYSAVISSETPEAVAKIAKQVAAIHIRQVKLKVGANREANRANIGVLREILGDSVDIRADANASWTPDDAVAHINDLVELGVFYVEQPLPAGDRNVWQTLQRRLPAAAKVYVDESICTLDDARWLAEHRAVSGFNLKISKHGGILPSLEIHRMAREHGLFCQLGCHVGETSILSAAGRILAALAGDLRACEGSYGLLLLEQDLTPAPMQFGYQGMGPVTDILKHPGLGIQVDLAPVDACLGRMPYSGE